MRGIFGLNGFKAFIRNWNQFKLTHIKIIRWFYFWCSDWNVNNSIIWSISWLTFFMKTCNWKVSAKNIYNNNMKTVCKMIIPKESLSLKRVVVLKVIFIIHFKTQLIQLYSQHYWLIEKLFTAVGTIIWNLFIIQLCPLRSILYTIYIGIIIRQNKILWMAYLKRAKYMAFLYEIFHSV